MNRDGSSETRFNPPKIDTTMIEKPTHICGPATPGLEPLRAAVANWVEEVEPLLFKDRAVSILAIPNEVWKRNGSNFEKKLDQRLLWDSAGLELIKSAKSYAAVKDAQRAIPQLRDLDESMLGTILGSMRIDDLTMTLFPSPEDLVANTWRQKLDLTIASLNDEIVHRMVHLTAISPIEGVTLKHEPLELRRGLSIRKLKDEEIARLIELGLITSPFHFLHPVVTVDERHSFALVEEFSLPLLQDLSESKNEFTALHERYAQQNPDALLECLSLATDYKVRVTGTMLSGSRFSVIGGGTSWGTRPDRPIHRAQELSDSETQQLSKIWDVVHSKELTSSKGLPLALRRLAIARGREQLEDRLLDLYIALEAFYLNDAGKAGDRGELRYRLSLRGAAWLDPADVRTGWTRRDVFKQLKIGYDLRSTIAHGGSIDPAGCVVDGVAVSMDDFVSLIAHMTRLTIRKAIDDIQSSLAKLAVDWDELLFPPASPE